MFLETNPILRFARMTCGEFCVVAVLIGFIPATIGKPAHAQESIAEKSPPNVVIVYTDDQGWGVLSCYGSTDINTPNIDALAAEGMRFTDFYVSQPVCSASRASLMSGCYANRVGASRTDFRLEPNWHKTSQTGHTPVHFHEPNRKHRSTIMTQ